MINNLQRHAAFANELKKAYNTFVARSVELASEYHRAFMGENAYDEPNLSEEEKDALNQKLLKDRSELIDSLSKGFQQGNYDAFIRAFLTKLDDVTAEEWWGSPTLDYAGGGEIDPPIDEVVILSDAHQFKTNIIVDEIASNDEKEIRKILRGKYWALFDEQLEILLRKEGISKEDVEIACDNVIFVNMLHEPVFYYLFGLITREGLE